MFLHSARHMAIPEISTNYREHFVVLDMFDEPTLDCRGDGVRMGMTVGPFMSEYMV
jgi:hypothetical protein